MSQKQDKSRRQIAKNRAANRHNPRMSQSTGEGIPVSQVTRLTGFSVRTIKRRCDAGQLASFRSPGGHVRVVKADLERFLRRGSPNPVSTSSVLQNRRERIEELNLEAQELRAKREIEKLRAEDAEAERRREAAAQAEELADERAREESRLQVAREGQRRAAEQRQAEAEQERREWVNGWVAWALNSVPKDAPREVALDVHQSVEEALAKFSPEQPQSVVQRLVLAGVDKALVPWRRSKEIEKAIQSARKELPVSVRTLSEYFEPTEWEVRAMRAARVATSQLPSDAAFEEIRAAGVQAGKQIASEYEREQARQQRERYKKFLVDIGVGHVSCYLSKLHSDGEIWDEDFDRKSELENAVRKALEDRLMGAEGFGEAQRLAREVVKKELE